MVAQHATAGTNKAGLGVGVAVFYFFLIVYSLGIGVCGVVFYNELFPNHIRAKGVALAIMSIALSGLVYLQATPEAFARIAWKFYLVSTSPIHSLFLHHPKDTNKNATRSSSASWPSA
jgi:hypothetical protein